MQYIFKLRFKNTRTKHYFTINTSVNITADLSKESAIFSAWSKAIARGTGLASIEDDIYLHEIKLLFVRR